MSRFLLKIRYLIEYIACLGAYFLLKLQPHFIVKAIAWFWGTFTYRLPQVSKLVNANIKTVFPEKNMREVKRIGRASMINMLLNIFEFLWMVNRRKRIEKYTRIAPETVKVLTEYAAGGARLIMVNPHLGSWEASGLMVPYYLDMKLAAVATPLDNPYLNKFFNSGNREKTCGMRIIFSQGAIRSAIKAMREGMNIGLLIDQNTKVRAGGIFVDFFGLPVPSSKAPAELARFALNNKIRTEIVFGVSLRDENGILIGRIRSLKKPFEQYEDREMIQELTNISEEFIRKYPEQYLWLYKRFAHIPADIEEERKARYPFYARTVKKSFYSRVKGRPARFNPYHDIAFTGEFFIPGKVDRRIEADHMERYRFACRLAAGKSVLDIACGVGYSGPLFMKAGAASYDGVDINERSIEYANCVYRSDRNINYHVGDICSFSHDKTFDLITCYETIEHVKNYESAIKNLNRLLQPNGLLLISSPNRAVTSPGISSLCDQPANKFHTQEFIPEELLSVLNDSGFTAGTDDIYGQRQRRIYKYKLLNKIARLVLGNPKKHASPSVTPVKDKAPRYFIITARKA
ncbi:MAG: methyltransferase domain-containing protein [Victivallaceae bacterium]|nr:methyltransferase domain-containing protein [Victivallaceae bacterium]